MDNGFDSLGAKQTAAYQDMIAAGVKDRDAYALIQSIQGAQKTDDKARTAVQRDVLRESKVSGDGKAIVYYGLMASEKEWAVMDQLADMVDAMFESNTPCDGSVLTNPRQFDAIRRAHEAMLAALQGLKLGLTPDAVLTDVEMAMEAMGEVTGATVREDITARIFERFCVGK